MPWSKGTLPAPTSWLLTIILAHAEIQKRKFAVALGVVPDKISPWNHVCTSLGSRSFYFVFFFPPFFGCHCQHLQNKNRLQIGQALFILACHEDLSKPIFISTNCCQT